MTKLPTNGEKLDTIWFDGLAVKTVLIFYDPTDYITGFHFKDQF